MTDAQKAKQVSDQCRVVVHLAKALIEVYSDYARMFGERPPNDTTNSIAEPIGRRSASIMETLGDFLNGEDEWTAPIFKEAHRLWPSPK